MRIEGFDPTSIYRYDRNTESIYIDIQLDFYRELYNEWDFSPLNNRDLDRDLLSYLETCCEEIPKKHRLILSLSIPEKIYDPEKEKKTTEGIRNFFRYLIRFNHRRMMKMFYHMFFVMVIGVSMIVTSTFIKYVLEESIARTLVYEGLVIGGWVAVWEFFSMIFFGLRTHRERLKSYQRLLNADIEYRYRQQT